MGVNYQFLAISIAGMCLAAAVFLRMAHVFGLVAHPNNRSSHGAPTVTGMGILIPLAVFVYNLWQPSHLSFGFLSGFFLVSIISFVDDVYFLKHSLRLFFQVTGLALMIFYLPFQSNGLEALAIGIAALLLGIGVINAYNFMDGINGMLALHSLLVLGSLLYLNCTYTSLEGVHKPFTNNDFIINLIIPIAIFALFNLRTNAKAFIGDVGAISIAFAILYLMYNLLLVSGNYTYLLLFCIFGADAGLTVVYKLILGENIFVPHRDFIFKKLVHVTDIAHLRVSLFYFILQGIINAVVLFAVPKNAKLSSQLSVLFITVVVLVTLYIFMQARLNKLQATKSSQLLDEETL